MPCNKKIKEVILYPYSGILFQVLKKNLLYKEIYGPRGSAQYAN